MNDLKTLNGFLNALSDYIEGANRVVSDAPAFLAASQEIKKLLEEVWSGLEADLFDKGISADEQRRLLQILALINGLEAKSRARLAWSEDFEAHMRRSMEIAT